MSHQHLYTLFVGRIKTLLDETDLMQIFERHGPVAGVRVQRNFAFVDYYTKEGAEKAVKAEDGKLYKGVNLAVQHSDQQKKKVPIELTPSAHSQIRNTMASDTNKYQANGGNSGPYSSGSSLEEQNYAQTSISRLFPEVSQLAERSKTSAGAYSLSRMYGSSSGMESSSGMRGSGSNMGGVGSGSNMGSMGSGSNMRDVGSSSNMRGVGMSPNMGGMSSSSNMGRVGSGSNMGSVGSSSNMRGVGMSSNMGGMSGSSNMGRVGSDIPSKRSRFEDDPSFSQRPPQLERSEKERDRKEAQPSYSPSKSEPRIQPSAPKPGANDCEIIAMSKNLRGYAETLEYQLKTIGVKVDILFPNSLSMVPLIIDDITSRGVRYAVVITSEDVVTNSVTVTYLQTNPQKKMRMFSKDAVSLIRSSCPSVTEVEKSRQGSASHPEEVTLTLNILLEGRPLSLAEYDKLLDYLTEKRDDLAKKMGVPARQKAEKSALSKDAIYQNVLSILKEKKSASTTPQLDNPELYDLNGPFMKKALETVLGNKNALSMLHTYSSRVLEQKK